MAGALGVAYLIVVPTLEASLVDAKLDQLEDERPSTVVACTEASEFLRGRSAPTPVATVLDARVVIY